MYLASQAIHHHFDCFCFVEEKAKRKVSAPHSYRDQLLELLDSWDAPSKIRLHAGELTKNELAAVRAVVKVIRYQAQNVPQDGPNGDALLREVLNAGDDDGVWVNNWQDIRRRIRDHLSRATQQPASGAPGGESGGGA